MNKFHNNFFLKVTFLALSALTLFYDKVVAVNPVFFTESHSGPYAKKEDRYMFDRNVTTYAWGVFDGHGQRDGHLCSDYLSRNLLRALLRAPAHNEAIIEAFKKINDDFFAINQLSGSTAIVALLDDTQFIFANTGDSRGVLYNKQGGELLTSADHKPNFPAEKARIEAAGGFVSIQEGVRPSRLMGILAMSRAFGDFDAKKFGLIVDPDVFTRKLDGNEGFAVLASDGLWDTMKNQDVAQFIMDQMATRNVTSDTITHQQIRKISIALVRHATEVLKSRDDTTVTIIFFKHEAAAGPANAVDDQAAPPAYSLAGYRPRQDRTDFSGDQAGSQYLGWFCCC